MTQPNDVCPACGVGKCRSVQRDLSIQTEDGFTVTVPKVSLLRCDTCGEEVVPARSHRYVDSFVADQAEQLSPDDVRNLFKRINDTQQAVCEHLGLGSKTLSRWLSGVQHPNRAMGFYLRVMAEFPDIYRWVKERKWKNTPLAPNVQPEGYSASMANRLERRIGPPLGFEGRKSTSPNYAQAFRHTSLKMA